MNIIRRVNDIECEIKESNELNLDIYERFSQIWEMINDSLSDQIPELLKEEIGEERIISCLNKATDYVMENIKTSPISNGTFIEDGLCYFYDLIEHESEDKDDYETFYMKAWCKPSQHRLIKEFARSNLVDIETTKDPMVHAIEEAVENAYQRDVFHDEIVNDVYLQINEIINDDDFVKLIADDYMIKNSI